MGSTRFPGKVLGKIQGHSVVDLISHRLSKATVLDDVIFAIPSSSADDLLEHELLELDQKVFRGEEQDVQKRFVDLGIQHEADILVRVTADCPLVDWKLVDLVVSKLVDKNADYCSNVEPPSFPDGLDVEAFTLNALIESRRTDTNRHSTEHVTTGLRERASFKRENIYSHHDLSHFRWTVDWQDDLDQLNEKLPTGFRDMDYLALLNSGFLGIVSDRIRNEGAEMGQGQKLWARAKTLIPGGSMLFSKSADAILPGIWPSYYSSASGIAVVDLDGNVYKDFSNMSVGACSLGYGNEQIDTAVKQAVDDGVMSTLNSPQEVELAGRLVEMHPWSDMVRFARTGGEANAIAIRVARAHTGRDKIAVCGYHGWHDWYLSANLNSEDNLKSHLMEGVAPKGVPEVLKDTVFPFIYNDLDGLSRILSNGDVAAVKMEVSRTIPPEPGFLQGVRELCDKNGAILIFDECTSGFREFFGGLHLKHGVNPDIAMFGKALGNGYAISAVIGSKKVMRAAESTFISSTFWTERIGPVAALASLDEMKVKKSWEKIPTLGAEIKIFWETLFDDLEMKHRIAGLDAIPEFVIESEHWTEIKTFITQEMLSRGFLASSAIYFSTEHDEQSISDYKEAFSEVIRETRELIEVGNLRSKLRGSPQQIGFRRFN